MTLNYDQNGELISVAFTNSYQGQFTEQTEVGINNTLPAQVNGALFNVEGQDIDGIRWENTHTIALPPGMTESEAIAYVIGNHDKVEVHTEQVVYQSSSGSVTFQGGLTTDAGYGATAHYTTTTTQETIVSQTTTTRPGTDHINQWTGEEVTYAPTDEHNPHSPYSPGDGLFYGNPTPTNQDNNPGSDWWDADPTSNGIGNDDPTPTDEHNPHSPYSPGDGLFYGNPTPTNQDNNPGSDWWDADPTSNGISQDDPAPADQDNAYSPGNGLFHDEHGDASNNVDDDQPAEEPWTPPANGPF